MTPTPAPQADELARLVRVVDAVPALVHTRRTALGLSARACAEQVRILGPRQGMSRPASFATVLRCESGKPLSVPVLRAFLVWLGRESEGVPVLRVDLDLLGNREGDRAALTEARRRAAEASGDPLLDTPALADYLGVSRNTIPKLRARGVLPPAVRIGGSVRWRRSAVDRWIDEQGEATS